jgi:hypothetical protein
VLEIAKRESYGAFARELVVPRVPARLLHCLPISTGSGCVRRPGGWCRMHGVIPCPVKAPGGRRAWCRGPSPGRKARRPRSLPTGHMKRCLSRQGRVVGFGRRRGVILRVVGAGERVAIRPVLKHGPRSLTCMRVLGCENPGCETKVKDGRAATKNGTRTIGRLSPGVVD